MMLQSFLQSKLRIVFIGVCLAPLVANGASVLDWRLEEMTADLNDKDSLQRGMGLYVNYCLGCHSLKFQRYERSVVDLEIPKDVALDNLVFTGQKIGDLMDTAMAPNKAKNWFGAPPPDLTMIARVRSPEWLYNYLKAFYVDESRPFGVNNKMFPNVGMPHALLDLQGVPREVCNGFKPRDLLSGKSLIGSPPVPLCDDIEVDIGTGIYNEAEYDQAAYDISNFLYYVGDPSRLDRYTLGYWVIGGLFILLIFAFFLNREYWKDVH